MTTQITEAQTRSVARCKLGIANIGAGNGYEIPLPPGAILLAVTVLTVTAFDGTTNTVSVGDGTTVFANAVDVKTTGNETVANAPKKYPSGGTLAITAAQTGAATVGEAEVIAEWIVVDRGTEQLV